MSVVCFWLLAILKAPFCGIESPLSNFFSLFSIYIISQILNFVKSFYVGENDKFLEPPPVIFVQFASFCVVARENLTAFCQICRRAASSSCLSQLPIAAAIWPAAQDVVAPTVRGWRNTVLCKLYHFNSLKLTIIMLCKPVLHKFIHKNLTQMKN